MRAFILSSRFGLLCGALAVLVLLSACRTPSSVASVPAPPPARDPVEEATAKVEQDRGEPTGRKAAVNTPAALKHYDNRYRFLSVQVAASLEQGYERPEDYAELARLIRLGEFVEMKQLGEHHILFGVGEKETDGPLTHYDKDTGVGVPLFALDEEYRSELSRLAVLIAETGGQVEGLRAQLKLMRKASRSIRRSLLARVSRAQKDIGLISLQKSVTESYCADPSRRRLLAVEYESLAKLAASIDGGPYDLADTASRRRFKVRLLSFSRPEAQQVIQEIAKAYGEQYNRPLPITSLVRTEQYQRHLSETNRNAARNAVPPHTTGQAFDIYYYFMSGAEQDFLMGEIARLKSEGRVEALRESRDNIHVFVFATGHPPAESLIATVMPTQRVRPSRRRR